MIQECFKGVKMKKYHITGIIFAILLVFAPRVRVLPLIWAIVFMIVGSATLFLMGFEAIAEDERLGADSGN